MHADTDMMLLRRACLDRLVDTSAVDRKPFADVWVDVRGYLSTPADPQTVPGPLADAVADRLVHTPAHPGAGAAVVVGLAELFDLAGGRVFHEALFRAVWEAFRARTGQTGEPGDFRVKAGIIADGEIPLELYGSRWSFKQLHIDREVLLFSHLYGPVSGFSGGGLLLVDILPYMSRRALRFDDVFEWSQEPTAGSKPVLRDDHREAALAECGVELGALDADQIVFVNNLPDAGVLHGATPVVVTDREHFRREYHRCSVKDLRLCRIG